MKILLTSISNGKKQQRIESRKKCERNRARENEKEMEREKKGMCNKSTKEKKVTRMNHVIAMEMFFSLSL